MLYKSGEQEVTINDSIEKVQHECNTALKHIYRQEGKIKRRQDECI